VAEKIRPRWGTTRRSREQDPGVGVRRRISFKATKLIASFQDDVESKGGHILICGYVIVVKGEI
jgi:hypothetical protein